MTATTATEVLRLLERDDELDALRAARDEALAGNGCLLLVAGEAGVGKTALLRRFSDDDGVPVRWGACDPLFTPRPLGPFVDIAESCGERFLDVVRAGGPHEVARALLAECAPGPAVVVLEDLHWADEATLDVVRLLARRVGDANVLVIGTFRDDELEATHPLRVVLGQLPASPAIRRIRIAPLTADAVAALAASSDVDPRELHSKTGGNPFFVTEVLQTPGATIPQTVRDAVVARTARLDSAARSVVEAAAIFRPEAEFWLLESLNDCAPECLDACLASGMLAATASGVTFRHELAREAIETSLPPGRRRSLHREALAALASTESSDVERLAHHADAAADGEAVVRYAPAAAERASARGAHREAADQYARALRYGSHLPLEQQARLALKRSWECYLTDQQEEAVAEARRAISAYSELGDRRREANAYRRLSAVLWCPGRTLESSEAAQTAVMLLEQLPPGRDLARAYGEVAALRMNAEDLEGTVEWATRGIDLALELGEDRIAWDNRRLIAAVEFHQGDTDGKAMLEESLERARGLGEDDLLGGLLISLRRERSISASTPTLSASSTRASSAAQRAACCSGVSISWRPAPRSSWARGAGTRRPRLRRESSASAGSRRSRGRLHCRSWRSFALDAAIPARCRSSKRRASWLPEPARSSDSDPSPRRSARLAGSPGRPTTSSTTRPTRSRSPSSGTQRGTPGSSPSGADGPASSTVTCAWTARRRMRRSSAEMRSERLHSGTISAVRTKRRSRSSTRAMSSRFEMLTIA